MIVVVNIIYRIRFTLCKLHILYIYKICQIMSKYVHLLYRGEKRQNDCEDDYLKEFHSRQLDATTVPILNFKFKSLKELSFILLEETNNQLVGVIITSPRTVEALSKVLLSLDNDQKQTVHDKLNSDLIFVVGEKTAKDCTDKLCLNYNTDSCKTGNSESLSDYILEYCNRNFPGKNIRLIYPKSSLADDAIESFFDDKSQFEINSLIVYETNVIENIAILTIEALNKIIDKFSEDEISCLIINLIFFSPSGVRGFVTEGDILYKLKQVFPNINIQFKYSCIGMTTRSELSRNDLEVFCVPEKPDPVSLAESVFKILTQESII